MQSPKFLTVEEASEVLQISPYTMRKYLKNGRVRGIKLGNSWRVPETALVELAEGADVTSVKTVLRGKKKTA